MSVLSNQDVKRELGKNIFISPFKLDNLKGGSINLTASKLGLSLKTKKSIYEASKNALVIPPNDTALVETEEAIYVNQKIGGSYHSKVTLVSQGVGHIGTTLDPGWIGPSLIALHNNSENEIRIPIGKSFVSIVFHYLKTKASLQNTNNAARPELLNDFFLSDEEKEWLDEDWRSHKGKLKEKMEIDVDYKKVKNEKNTKYICFKSGFAINIYLSVLCLIFFLICKNNMVTWDLDYKDFLAPILAVYLGSTGGQLTHAFK